MTAKQIEQLLKNMTFGELRIVVTNGNVVFIEQTNKIKPQELPNDEQ